MKKSYIPVYNGSETVKIEFPVDILLNACTKLRTHIKDLFNTYIDDRNLIEYIIDTQSTNGLPGGLGEQAKKYIEEVTTNTRVEMMCNIFSRGYSDMVGNKYKEFYNYIKTKGFRTQIKDNIYKFFVKYLKYKNKTISKEDIEKEWFEFKSYHKNSFGGFEIKCQMLVKLKSGKWSSSIKVWSSNKNHLKNVLFFVVGFNSDFTFGDVLGLFYHENLTPYVNGNKGSLSTNTLGAAELKKNCLWHNDELDSSMSILKI